MVLEVHVVLLQSLLLSDGLFYSGNELPPEFGLLIKVGNSVHVVFLLIVVHLIIVAVILAAVPLSALNHALHLACSLRLIIYVG